MSFIGCANEVVKLFLLETRQDSHTASLSVALEWSQEVGAPVVGRYWGFLCVCDCGFLPAEGKPPHTVSQSVALCSIVVRSGLGVSGRPGMSTR
jgi:hypothetical protein